MEFIRLADVAVVETANDTDKVLIEQNGEIKRVAKTEVGGSGGGNMLILNAVISDPSSFEMSLVSSNMTLNEAITAMSNKELTGAMFIFDFSGMQMYGVVVTFADYTSQINSAAIMFYVFMGDDTMPILWTADGIQMME